MTKEIMLHFCKGNDELIFSKFQTDSKGLYYEKELDNEIQRRANISISKTDNANKRWKPEPYRINPDIPEYKSV